MTRVAIISPLDVMPISFLDLHILLYFCAFIGVRMDFGSHISKSEYVLLSVNLLLGFSTYPDLVCLNHTPPGYCHQGHHKTTKKGDLQWCVYCLWINGHWSSSNYSFWPTTDKWSLSGMPPTVSLGLLAVAL